MFTCVTRCTKRFQFKTCIWALQYNCWNEISFGHIVWHKSTMELSMGEALTRAYTHIACFVCHKVIQNIALKVLWQCDIQMLKFFGKLYHKIYRWFFLASFTFQNCTMLNSTNVNFQWTKKKLFLINFFHFSSTHQ